MDRLISGKGHGPEGGPEPTVSLDPLLELRVERTPWEIRAAQWRAWALAELVFGSDVQVRLGGNRGPAAFRGLLTLTVPFADLGTHRERESIFMDWVREDPVLAYVPFIYVFEPNPIPTDLGQP